jgi:hypothetical protein
VPADLHELRPVGVHVNGAVHVVVSAPRLGGQHGTTVLVGRQSLRHAPDQAPAGGASLCVGGVAGEDPVAAVQYKEAAAAAAVVAAVTAAAAAGPQQQQQQQPPPPPQQQQQQQQQQQ